MQSAVQSAVHSIQHVLRVQSRLHCNGAALIGEFYNSVLHRGVEWQSEPIENGSRLIWIAEDMLIVHNKYRVGKPGVEHGNENAIVDIEVERGRIFISMAWPPASNIL